MGRDIIIVIVAIVFFIIMFRYRMAEEMRNDVVENIQVCLTQSVTQ